MIRMIQSLSAAQAKNYFNEALGKSDYYVNDQELQGHVRGKLAARLGIEGAATKEIFQALAENIHPRTGKKLTPRTSDRRTVGYDINFHCPKSVSILHVLSKDNHILDAFQTSVTEVMQDIEHDCKTRKRKAGCDDDIQTGELVWADFIHQTARPVDGAAPDPHLHCHCFTFNATWDDIEQRYKAAQFRDIKRDMPYYQAKFHKVLSDRLLTLGYGIRKTETAFEVEGIPQAAIDRFSKRTNEIGQAAKENNITDAKELDKLGGRTRTKKQKGLSMSGLKKDWRRQIRALGLKSGQSNALIRHQQQRDDADTTTQDCIRYALDHCFERASVVQDRRLLAKGFEYAIGRPTVSAAAVIETFDADNGIYKASEGGKTLCTTWEIVEQEKQMIGLAMAGKGQYKPLYNTLPPTTLAGEQQAAVTHLLTTPDQVAIIEGRAGTGKTTLMKEAVKLMEGSGKRVTVVASTSEASRGVLRNEGFANAETVAKLLNDPKLQSSLAGQVLWVDEAGLLGVQDMAALLRLATEYKARLVLSGDTRQHSAVVGGDALRVLKELAGVPTVSLNTIYRQRHAGYKEAVHDLSKGKVAAAFRTLDKLDAIKSIATSQGTAPLAADYVAALRKGKTALVVSPTHKQGAEITDTIRQGLKAAKKIGKTDTTVRQLVSLNMTDAEKADPRNYQKGLVLQFTQNQKNILRGSSWAVQSVKGKTLTLLNDRNERTEIAVEKKNSFEVYKETSLQLAKGDMIRITRNGFDSDKKRLNNGHALEVVAIDKKGIMRVRHPASRAEYTLPAGFGHIAHGYCLTSHASQGKTVDEVFIYQPADTFPATDLKQFYVSVSRGRDKVHLYTDDKEALIDHASKMRDRQSGLELVGLSAMRENLVTQKPFINSTRQRFPAYRF